MLAINIAKKDRKEMEALFPAKWKRNGVHYLGFRFSASLQNMVKDNIEELWHKVNK